MGSECRFTDEMAAQLEALVEFNNHQWPHPGNDWQGYLRKAKARLAQPPATGALRFGAEIVDTKSEPSPWDVRAGGYVLSGGLEHKWSKRDSFYDRYGVFKSYDAALSALNSAPPPPGWDAPTEIESTAQMIQERNDEIAALRKQVAERDETIRAIRAATDKAVGGGA